MLSEDGVAALTRGGGTIPTRIGARAGWQEVINAIDDKRIRKVVIGHEKMAELKDKGYKLIEDIIVRKQLK
jgi:hypothetical protein